MIILFILFILGLAWLTRKLIKAYPNSPHPRWLAKKIRPLIALAQRLINRLKKFAT